MSISEMLLTTKQPAHHSYKFFHDYSPPTPPSATRFSPALASTVPSFPHFSSSHKSLPPVSLARSTTQQMSTPHRGLPPPAAMTLPQPSQQPPPISQNHLPQSMGQLPAPPQQWQGAEEPMRNWLHAKAEEDKRKQEEEKTRQEVLRLEQRKIEQDMLRTSLNGGIPPYMIPMVFAGMGGGNLPNASLEWAQHYLHQQQPNISQQQQLLPSQVPTSPEQHHLRRDSRVIGPPYMGAQPPAPITLPSTPIGPGDSQQGGGFLPGYQVPQAARSRAASQGQGNLGRVPPSQLPKINTGELKVHAPGSGMNTLAGQPTHPLQQSQPAQHQESQASPSIYFHHWQPPTSHAQAGPTSNAIQPTTPSDHTSSPKKRKATGLHQPAPMPSSQPQYTSPPFSQGGSSVTNTPSNRRRGHSRQRSDLSTTGTTYYGRPPSQHHHADSGFSSHGMTSPIIPPGPELPLQRPAEPRRHSGGSHPLSSLLEQPGSRNQTPSQTQGQAQTHAQSHLQSQQTPRDAHYSAGSEVKHEARRTTPEEDHARRERERAGSIVIKRENRRD